MERVKAKRIISERPWVIEAIITRWKPIILPEEYYANFASFAYDVGATLRSREFQVGIAAYAVAYQLLRLLGIGI